MLILRELREEAGLTQKQFAEKINSMQRNISNWEKGINQPDLQTLIAIADFFQVSLDELCGRDKNDFKNTKANSLMKTVMNLTPEQQAAIENLIKSFGK